MVIFLHRLRRERERCRICSEVCFEEDWKWITVTRYCSQSCLIKLFPARETFPGGHETVSIYHYNKVVKFLAFSPSWSLSYRMERRLRLNISAWLSETLVLALALAVAQPCVLSRQVAWGGGLIRFLKSLFLFSCIHLLFLFTLIWTNMSRFSPVSWSSLKFLKFLPKQWLK